jgi:ribonuclease HI
MSMKYWRRVYTDEDDLAYAWVGAHGQFIENDEGEVLVRDDVTNDDLSDSDTYPPESLTVLEDALTEKIYVHVDGSAAGSNPGLGGAGIAAVGNNIKIIRGCPLGENVTNQVAEVQAVGEAISLLEGDIEGSCIDIYSDSQYAVNCLNGNWSPSENLHVIYSVQQQLNNYNVELHWIEGHAGEFMNEVADRVAKRAAVNQSGVKLDDFDTLDLGEEVKVDTES